jgi:glycosyltransferase involved in cell wall biosynthesis
MMRQLVDIPVHVVTNGFDPEEFNVIDGDPPENWGTSRTNMVYTGMIYPGRRDPRVLFQAIQSLVRTGALGQGDLKLWFYGPNVEAIRGMVSAYSVGPFVELSGFVSRKDALNCQKHADLLLLLEWTDSAAGGVFTGKLFEYLGAGKPILAIGPPDGVIDQTLKETGMGVLENDPKKLATIIRNFMRKKSMKEDGTAHTIDPGRLKKFTREYQAGRLAHVLDWALSKKADI